MLLRTVKLILLFTPLFLSSIAFANDMELGNPSKPGQTSREEYIALHKEDAVRDMKKTGVPASITMAQALLESEDGNSPLAREANNHFGIKCTSDWTGPSYTQDDDKKDECFRKYKSVLESYDDHSYFLKTRQRYSALFELKPTDYKEWAKGLKKSGYATNPRYADQLIKIIEDFQLYKLDTADTDNLTASTSTTPDYTASYSTKKIEEKKKETSKSSAKHAKNQSVNNTVDPFSDSHAVMKNNGVPYIIAKKGDTYDRIAKENEMMSWLIYKYNDVPHDATIKEGQLVYIKPKHRSAEQDYYVVKDGDTMQSISQELGIKMKMLYKRNHLEKGTEAKVGDKLWVNKKKDVS